MSEISKQASPAKERPSFFFGLARLLADILFNTILPVRVYGIQKVPQDPPYILVGNHTSWFDPVIMAWKIRRRQVIYVGKKELAKNRLIGAILKEMRCITVDRHNSDMTAMRAIIKTVKTGHILGIFPEGTRHHQGVMEEIEDGTSLIALRCNVPLIPMYIDGKPRLFKRTRCFVGNAIPTADLIAEGVNKETCDKLNQRMTEAFAEMVADAKKISR